MPSGLLMSRSAYSATMPFLPFQRMRPILVASNLQAILTAPERKADAEFEEELLQVGQQGKFEIALVSGFG